jgi:fatty acid desaturase
VRERAEFRRYRKERERIERRSMMRALIMLAVLVLAGSIAHAGLDRVFVHGWWRP